MGNENNNFANNALDIVRKKDKQIAELKEQLAEAQKPLFTVKERIELGRLIKAEFDSYSRFDLQVCKVDKPLIKMVEKLGLTELANEMKKDLE